VALLDGLDTGVELAVDLLVVDGDFLGLGRDHGYEVESVLIEK